MAGKTYIYIIEENYGGFFKIGIAGDVAKRSINLQTGNPRPLTARYTKIFSNRSIAKTIESRVHNILEEHSLNGEWFSCTYEDAVTAIETASV